MLHAGGKRSAEERGGDAEPPHCRFEGCEEPRLRCEEGIELLSTKRRVWHGFYAIELLVAFDCGSIVFVLIYI